MDGFEKGDGISDEYSAGLSSRLHQYWKRLVAERDDPAEASAPNAIPPPWQPRKTVKRKPAAAPSESVKRKPAAAPSESVL